MVNFKKVSKIYQPDIVALDNINLKIKQGEFISLVGQSGAGKSTLLKVLTAEERPTKGDIILDNENLNDVKTKHLHLVRRKIGTVFQDFKLLSYRTVYENIAFAMEVAGVPDEEIASDLPQILELVNLVGKENRYPREISGGERQRTALARALAHRPKIIVADEPTGNLDLLNTWDIVQLLLKINKLGTTVFLATHNKDIVDSLNKRVITLDKGKVIRDQENGKYIL